MEFVFEVIVMSQRRSHGRTTYLLGSCRMLETCGKIWKHSCALIDCQRAWRLVRRDHTQQVLSCVSYPSTSHSTISSVSSECLASDNSSRYLQQGSQLSSNVQAAGSTLPLPLPLAS
eukprot:166324-Hanusia_phi.AAC.5